MRESIAGIVRLLAVRRDLLRRVRVRPRSPRHRAGHVLVTTALLLTFLVGLVAFAVDIGAMAVVRGELQRSADAAALAAAAELRREQPFDRAVAEASRYGLLNPVAAEPLSIAPSDVVVGIWDFDTRQFTPRADGFGNAVRVTGRTSRGTLFFGRVAGNTEREFQAFAVAAATPREIALVLDVSGLTAADDRASVLAAAEIAKSVVQATIAANLQTPDADGGRYRDRISFITVDRTAQLRQPLGGADAEYQRTIDLVTAFADNWSVADDATGSAARTSTNSATLGDALSLAARHLSLPSDGGLARRFADPLMIIVTDGVTVARSATLQPAVLIGDSGWRTIVVGVGRQVSSPDLARLSAALGPMSQVATVADEREFETTVRSSVSDRLESVRTVLAE